MNKATDKYIIIFLCIYEVFMPYLQSLIGEALLLIGEALLLIGEALLLIGEALLLIGEALLLIGEALLLIGEALLLIPWFSGNFFAPIIAS
jgi:hypothetical protein